MPITEIKVDSIQNIKQLIIETQKDDTIGRYRSPALFRGLPNSTYTLHILYKLAFIGIAKKNLSN